MFVHLSKYLIAGGYTDLHNFQMFSYNDLFLCFWSKYIFTLHYTHRLHFEYVCGDFLSLLHQ